MLLALLKRDLVLVVGRPTDRLALLLGPLVWLAGLAAAAARVPYSEIALLSDALSVSLGLHSLLGASVALRCHQRDGNSGVRLGLFLSHAPPLLPLLSRCLLAATVTLFQAGLLLAAARAVGLGDLVELPAHPLPLLLALAAAAACVTATGAAALALVGAGATSVGMALGLAFLAAAAEVRSPSHWWELLLHRANPAVYVLDLPASLMSTPVRTWSLTLDLVVLLAASALSLAWIHRRLSAGDPRVAGW